MASFNVHSKQQVDDQVIIFTVHSSRTFYRVVVDRHTDEVTLFSPGIEKTFEISDEGEGGVPSNLTAEGQALLAVIYLEEQQ